MPLPGIKSCTTKVDGKDILLLWIKLGTLERVSNHFFELGRKTSGGKPYQYCYLAVPVYRWIINNIEEAWKIYQDAGTPFSRDQFNKWLIRVAMRPIILGASATKFLDWISANGLEQYKELYERRYPNIPDDRWLEAR
jgi:hypothetical protein